jgi:hypothetical protein
LIGWPPYQTDQNKNAKNIVAFVRNTTAAFLSLELKAA